MKTSVHALLLSLLLTALPCVLGNPMSPEEYAEAKEDYEKRVERYELDANPKRHRTLARWCKREFPEKYHYHQREYNKYVFLKAELELDGDPDPDDFKDLAEKAKKLGLADKRREYHGKWGEAMMSVYLERVPDGDTRKMKKLLTWAHENQVTFIDPVRELAEDLVALEAEDSLAREILGQVQVDGKWQTIDELLATINIKDAEQRVDIHRKLAEARRGKEVEFPSNPLRGADRVAKDTYLMTTPQSAGLAEYFLVVNGYSRSRPASLVIELHGGGEGGQAQAKKNASISVKRWSRAELDGGQVVLAPIARNHVVDSWRNRDNFIDLMDALDETVKNFNIDRKRIYVTGTSMGGGGTSAYFLNYPDMAAAFCARAGYYFRNHYIKKVLDSPLMIIHGEKDTAQRNGTRDQLLEHLKRIDAKHTYISLPEAGHGLPPDTVNEHMLPFFEENQNAFEIDFRVIRAAGLAYYKN